MEISFASASPAVQPEIVMPARVLGHGRTQLAVAAAEESQRPVVGGWAHLQTQHLSDEDEVGEFNRLLQHLNKGGVVWEERRGGCKSRPADLRCIRQVDLGSISGLPGRRSGKVFQRAYQAKLQPTPASFMRCLACSALPRYQGNVVIVFFDTFIHPGELTEHVAHYGVAPSWEIFKDFVCLAANSGSLERQDDAKLAQQASHAVDKRRAVLDIALAYTFPGIQKVVQAAGRVIRTESDTGTVLLLDERYLEYQYRRLLPEWWRIGDS